MHIANSDRPVEFYNLEVIISVGYRVKSQQGTRFRLWATKTLREHLTQGYTLNRQRFEENARDLEAAGGGFCASLCLWGLLFQRRLLP